MKLILILITTLFLLLPGLKILAGDDIPEEFQKLLDKAQLEFNKPDGFKLNKVSENPLMIYDVAYKHSKNDVEVRYLIKNPDNISDKHNAAVCESSFVSIVNKFTKKVKDGMPLDAKKLKADWGLAVEVETTDDFGENYKYCAVIGISKFKTADVYIYMLYNDNKVLAYEFEKLIFSMKFK